MTSQSNHSLPTYISLPDASHLAGLPIRALQERIRAGTIKAITINGEIAVSKQSAIQVARQSMPKEQLPEYKQFQHLKGKAIWISESARKYEVANPTLVRWSQAGYIKRLGRNGNKVLLDEADVAYCAFVYKQVGGQGKHIFNSDGTPYTPRALQTA